MAYEGAYLKYDFNIVVRSQGTRSILPATSLRIFVDANKDIQQIWSSYPQIDNNLIAVTLVDNKKDFEPGAWWVKAGPGCANAAALLSDSPQSFQDWERTCIYGGVDTIDARTTIYQTVYNALT
ncbi:hypothetical protein BGZ98_006188 [Dissophora globulifera]|nr:hypothetical protein BGZ98_006188 [Dissophora globulifera]